MEMEKIQNTGDLQILSESIVIDICDDESSSSSDCVLSNILSEQVSAIETLEVKDINDSCCNKENQEIVEVVLYDSDNDGDLIHFIQTDFVKQKYETCTQDSNDSGDIKRDSVSHSLIDREEILIESDLEDDINDINDVLIITPKLEQEIKCIEVNEFNNIDDCLVESNRNEYLQSLHSIKNSKLNIEKFLSFLEDAALNIKYCNKSKCKPAKNRRQRNRRYRETSTPDNESFKFDCENSDFFKSLRKHSCLSKKCLKTCRYLLEQSKNNSDKEMIEHYLDITKRFEKLRKIFDDYAIIETLNNKNKNDISRKIDLHGLRKREALIVLKVILKEIELDESRMGKSKEYIVITGKGKHSKNGPVLKPAIESYLKDMKIPYKELNHNGGFILNLTNYSKSRISD